MGWVYNNNWIGNAFEIITRLCLSLQFVYEKGKSAELVVFYIDALEKNYLYGQGKKAYIRCEASALWGTCCKLKKQADNCRFVS